MAEKLVAPEVDSTGRFWADTNQHVHLLWENDTELFKVTPEGKVFRDGKDITSDDRELADCFCLWLKASHSITVDR